jgi:hypothetical protein
MIINNGNNTFTVNDTDIVLENQNYTSGDDLAMDIHAKVINTPITSVTFDGFTNRLTFTGSSQFTLKFDTGTCGRSVTSENGTPAAVLGFTGADVTSDGAHEIVSGSINLTGVQSIMLKLTSGEDEIDRGLYIGNDIYFGRILDKGGDTFYHSHLSDEIEQVFIKSNKKDFTTIRIHFYWNNGHKIIPYDFQNRDHILKLEIDCNTDKLNSIVVEHSDDDGIPPVIDIPSLRPLERADVRDKIIPVIISIVLLLGLVTLSSQTVRKQKMAPKITE